MLIKIQILGERMANRASLEGMLCDAEESLSIGWVDARANHHDERIEMSVNKVNYIRENVLSNIYIIILIL